MRRFFLIALALFFLSLFFSHRLLKVPPGLTVDEAAFGYNAVLLSRTGRDQNGRLLPVFVLSIEGRDWRQPVTQYWMALFFRIFGPSYFNLRFTSILVALTSLVLIFYLARLHLNQKAAFLASFIFLTTPIIMIQSHLALDNIMPVPFVLFWLLGLFLFEKTGKNKYLSFSAAGLGIGFYTYKAMRIIVPVLTILTLFYLGLDYLKDFSKKNLKKILIFSFSILPFFAIIPLLEWKYAGAVFDRQKPGFGSWDSFFFPYLSSFDPSFLFLKGDATFYHSTGRHGMFLLASLPLFLAGIYQGVKEKKFWRLVLASFFLTPVFFGLVNSVHRASRLLALIPAYVLIAALGGVFLFKKKKIFFLIIFSLMIVNYFDFLKYYWFVYPKAAREWFSNDIYQSYLVLARESEKRNLAPWIARDIYLAEGESSRFFEAAYFKEPLEKWTDDQFLPENAILMTNRKEVPGLERLELEMDSYYLQINSQEK